MKEISKLNKTVEEVSMKNLELIYEVANVVYKKVREGIIDDEEIVEKCGGIVGFDYIIYDSKRKIEGLRRRNEGFRCSCGKNLSYDDKFCGGCGKRVEHPKDDIDYIICNNCEIDIDSESIFCPCCGAKII